MINILFPTYKANSISIAILILRVAFAAMLMTHGWAKLSNFSATAVYFENMGIGKFLVGLVVFAEFFCSIAVILGFLQRLALIPMIINMSVAFIVVHGAKLVGEGNGELAFCYLIAFISLIISGAGKYSVDNVIGNYIQKKE